jgi:hypothetical protein
VSAGKKNHDPESFGINNREEDTDVVIPDFIRTTSSQVVLTDSERALMAELSESEHADQQAQAQPSTHAE